MTQIKLTIPKPAAYDSLALILASAAIIATYIRLYFGIDFNDESYSIALSYQYTLGAKPYIDDITFLPFAILILPFVKLYYWITQSNNGIILFARHLYFAFNLLTASIIFLVIKNLLRGTTALLVALSCVVFIPFNIPNLSYNTMGSGLFTVGCFLGILGVLKRKYLINLFFSGLCHGLAIFSYPPIIIPLSIYLCFLIFGFIPLSQKKRSVFSYILGGMPIAFLLTKIFLDAGINNVLTNFNYAQSIGHQSSLSKLNSIIQSLWSFYPHKFLVLLILIFVYFLVKKSKNLGFANTFLLLPLIPIPIIYSGYIQHCSCIFSIGYLFYYSLLAPYLLLFIKQDKDIKTLFYLGWLPSFIGGFTMAYSSANGYVNTGLGMLSASLVTTILLLKAYLNNISFSSRAKDFRLGREWVAPLLVVLFLSSSQYYLFKSKNVVYLDADIHKLNSRVESGPFSGLYTTQEKKDYLSGLSKDLETVLKRGDKVIFYYNNFPAGYLMTSMRSATNAMFVVDPKFYPDQKYPKEYIAMISNYLRKQLENYSVIAVQMKKILERDYYTSEEANKNDFIGQIVAKMNSDKLVSKENYSIYRVGSK